MTDRDSQVVEFLPPPLLRGLHQDLETPQGVPPDIDGGMAPGDQEIEGCNDKLGEGVCGSLFTYFSLSFCN